MDSSVDEDASMLSMMVLSLSNWVRARKPAQGSERRPAALRPRRRRHPCVCFLPLAGRDSGSRRTLSALQRMWHLGGA